MIQIADVPDDLHRRLEARATATGLSVPDFVLRELKKSEEEFGSALARGNSGPFGTAAQPKVAAVTGRYSSRGARPPLIVLDASAVDELLLNTATGQKIARRIRDPQITLHAPHLVDLEVASGT